MRLLAILGALCCVDIASACPIEDAPYAHASAMRRAPLETFGVPPRPRFFVKGALPRFTTQGGEPMAYTHAVIDEDGDISRVDLDVTEGWIRVEYPNYEETFWIDPALRPKTRSLTREVVLAPRSFDFEDQHSFRIDSDAIAFRFDDEVVFNQHTTMYPADSPRRITALYADRTEQVIYEREPLGAGRAYLLAGILLSALSLLAWFVSIGPASPREVRP